MTKEDEALHTVQPGSYNATDLLGRKLPTACEVGAPRDGKFVGIFYWTWHGAFADHQYAYNTQQILNENPDLDPKDPDAPEWGKPFAYHFWNEPVYGYYSGTDEWVLRRQAELLADAGVDVIVFDNTNGTFTWLETALCLLHTFDQARKDGIHTPQIAFMLPFVDPQANKTQLLELYEHIYQKNICPELWFRWEGKPLMLGLECAFDPAQTLEAEIRQFFTFRSCQPDYAAGQTAPKQWGWLCAYPQAVFRREDGSAEQMTVGVAQNRSFTTNRLAPMSGEDIMGRSYTSQGYRNEEDAALHGHNFAEQWEYALEQDPDFIFVTGWNEWVAQRLPEWEGVRNAFPDQYNDEYSRDIEPTKGRLKDAYYYQLCSYIRKFKGAAVQEPAGAQKQINLNGDASQWNDVLPRYVSCCGNTKPRRAYGYLDPATSKQIYYLNTSGRNDICEAKVADDDEFLYFTVCTAEALTDPSGENWMRLLISAGGKDGWEGFDFIVNRLSPDKDGALLERFCGGWSFEQLARVPFSVQENRLTVQIPKKLLSLPRNGFSLDFKWMDNNLADGDIMDAYTLGDAAPAGRFTYCYERKQ